MRIYCCGCEQDVEAQLTSGREVYHHREDLWRKRVWQCPNCKNFVGVHEGSKNNKPLGVIATMEIKQLRMAIHRRLDKLWKSGRMTRGECYAYMSRKLGHPYHTANLSSVRECLIALNAVKELMESKAKDK